MLTKLSHWLGHLSVGRKLTLIYLLDLTAVIYVSGILIHEKYLAIDFARKEIVVQLIGVVAVVVYSGVMSAALLWFTNLLVGLRVEDGAEVTGLDITQHREHMGT